MHEPENYSQAMHLAAGIFAEAKLRGFNLKLLDIGGGFPAHYDETVPPFKSWRKRSPPSWIVFFPNRSRSSPSRGGSWSLPPPPLLPRSSAKPSAGGKLCYYINDGVYHTYSGMIFDHAQYHLKGFKKGPTQICSVFGPTCDALDTISLTEQLPDLKVGELVYSENIGAYSAASSTSFNGFPPAKVVHVNQQSRPAEAAARAQSAEA